MVGPVPPPEGGIASVMQDIIDSDLSSTYQFEVFARQPSLPGDLHSSIGRNLYRLRRFIHFLILLLRYQYYAVHIHSPDQAFIGTVIFMVLARLARVPVLLHHHGTDWQSFYPDVSPLRQRLIRFGLLLPKCLLVLYDHWEKELIQILPNARVQVLRNLAHDLTIPSEDALQVVREQWGLFQDDFVVITVGSVGRRKGSFDIVNAAKVIAGQDRGIKFILVGGEELPDELSQVELALEQGRMEQSVILTGEVERSRIPWFLAAADVFLLPSYYEGMPISLIEAMRSGLAIITTPVAGIPEMISAEETGLFVEPGSFNQIASAVIRLKDDAILRNKLGKNARAAFEERFEFSRGIEQLKQIYTSLRKA